MPLLALALDPVGVRQQVSELEVTCCGFQLILGVSGPSGGVKSKHRPSDCEAH